MESGCENNFEYDFAAEVTDHEQDETSEGPARGNSAAPAELVAAPQQGGEHEPGDDRQHRLVSEVLREQILEEHRTGQDREPEQHLPGPQQPEQQAAVSPNTDDELASDKRKFKDLNINLNFIINDN